MHATFLEINRPLFIIDLANHCPPHPPVPVCTRLTDCGGDLGGQFGGLADRRLRLGDTELSWRGGRQPVHGGNQLLQLLHLPGRRTVLQSSPVRAAPDGQIGVALSDSKAIKGLGWRGLKS